MELNEFLHVVSLRSSLFAAFRLRRSRCSTVGVRVCLCRQCNVSHFTFSALLLRFIFSSSSIDGASVFVATTTNSSLIFFCSLLLMYPREMMRSQINIFSMSIPCLSPSLWNTVPRLCLLLFFSPISLWIIRSQHSMAAHRHTHDDTLSPMYPHSGYQITTNKCIPCIRIQYNSDRQT